MRYLNLYFDTRKNPDLYDTNRDVIDTNRLANATKTVTFELVKTPTTEKLLKLMQRSLATHGADYAGSGFRYNYYIKKNLGIIRDAKSELNATIDRINAMGLIKIPENLRVDAASDKVDNDELNALHYIFETERSKKPGSEPPLCDLLWRINNLVHVIEGAIAPGKTELYPVWQMVAGLDQSERTALEPEDYKTFEFVEPGNIYIDYNTIGKDLFDCFITNDVELVQQKAVKQQLDMSLTFFVAMSGIKEPANGLRDRFNRWLKANDLGKYIDLSNPRYLPGRALLGRLVRPRLLSSEWLREWDQTYSLAGFNFSEQIPNSLSDERDRLDHNLFYRSSARYLNVYFDDKATPALDDLTSDVIKASRLERANKKLTFELVPSSVTDKFLRLAKAWLDSRAFGYEGASFHYSYRIKKNSPLWLMVSNTHYNERIELEPDDYQAFEPMQPGNVYLDYGILGSDLMSCFQQRDVGLVKKGALRQQLDLGLAFMLYMTGTSRPADELKWNYWTWVKLNGLNKYIDMKNPIYTPGRALLGRLVEPKITGADWFKQWDRTYSLAGFNFSE